MGDGVLLVVDAFDGPMPQTRFVLRKALELGRTPIVVINKTDRPGADPMRVHDEVLDLFIELEATEAQLDAPVVYASAREGVATIDMEVKAVDLDPLFDMIIKAVPQAPSDSEAPSQMLISTIDFSPYLGRLGIGRIERGTVKVGDQVLLLPMDTTQKSEQAKVTKLYVYDGLERTEVQSAPAGEIVSLAGLEGVVQRHFHQVARNHLRVGQAGRGDEEPARRAAGQITGLGRHETLRVQGSRRPDNLLAKHRVWLPLHAEVP